MDLSRTGWLRSTSLEANGLGSDGHSRRSVRRDTASSTASSTTIPTTRRSGRRGRGGRHLGVVGRSPVVPWSGRDHCRSVSMCLTYPSCAVVELRRSSVPQLSGLAGKAALGAAVAPAARARQRVGEGLPALAGPAHLPGGVADDQGVVGDVVGHHGAGADHRPAADGDATDDGGVGADGGPAPHQRRLPRGRAALERHPRPRMVGEDHVRPQEHLVLDGHPVPDQHAVLDGDRVAEHRPALDIGVVADVAVRADPGAGQDVRERPDAGAGADVVALAERQLVHEHRRVPGHRRRLPAARARRQGPAVVAVVGGSVVAVVGGSVVAVVGALVGVVGRVVGLGPRVVVVVRRVVEVVDPSTPPETPRTPLPGVGVVVEGGSRRTVVADAPDEPTSGSVLAEGIPVRVSQPGPQRPWAASANAARKATAARLANPAIRTARLARQPWTSPASSSSSRLRRGVSGGAPPGCAPGRGGACRAAALPSTTAPTRRLARSSPAGGNIETTPPVPAGGATRVGALPARVAGASVAPGTATFAAGKAAFAAGTAAGGDGRMAAGPRPVPRTPPVPSVDPLGVPRTPPAGGSGRPRAALRSSAENGRASRVRARSAGSARPSSPRSTRTTTGPW